MSSSSRELRLKSFGSHFGKADLVIFVHLSVYFFVSYCIDDYDVLEIYEKTRIKFLS